jgi:hypothetical protein
VGANEGSSGAEVRAFVTEREVTPAAGDFGELCYGKRQPAIQPAPRRRSRFLWGFKRT